MPAALGHSRSLGSKGCDAGCAQPRRGLGVLYLAILSYPRNLILIIALPAYEGYAGPASIVSCAKGGNCKVNYSHWEDQAKQTSQTSVRDWENTFGDFAEPFSVTKNQEREVLQQVRCLGYFFSF